ncbi:MAG: sulfurtransferase [Desulfobacterium sp.]|nr:sulfurtransferase [Desulfobacterium sp.]MBU3947484.1 YeeE/YedE family protein [Pseudomonadota bacterium]MBU4011017.1 YeeE/YedE family protein [Pseudomonadota bacterium]MBU4037505.1 YeeE/YedE family protein [Pseudomonadota bacterium]
MIETFFHNGTLATPAAFLASLLIGIAFGMALENAGFGSSRRLSGIFYFRDMAVLKVMFTAVVVAMLGVCYAKAFGWITIDNVYFLHTLYAAQIVGGLIFGAGFVMSGWCPGTGAVGLASGKVDALVFLLGAAGGSMLYNEVYPILGSITTADRGVVFAYNSLGISEASLAFFLTLIAVGCFWGSEYIEKKGQGTGEQWGTPFLKTFSAVLIAGAFGLFAVADQDMGSTSAFSKGTQETKLLEGTQAGLDHIEPQELADRLLSGDTSIILVDIRTPMEFTQFHIRSAINIPVVDLAVSLASHKNQGLIVLYSNGMTHPAQAHDSLFRLGFRNVYFLTDGLKGFLETCLKPVSLRPEPVSHALASKINAWRAFFLSPSIRADDQATNKNLSTAFDLSLLTIPGLVETDWLNTNLGKPGLKIIDLRAQPEYNSGHIPGSLSLNLESLRGLVRGLPSSLLPAVMLAEHFSLMGVRPNDFVVLVCTDKLQDATLVGMACERLQHSRYGILRGGFPKWQAEKRPLDTILPSVEPSQYPVPDRSDTFTVTSREVLTAIDKRGTIILDVRPADNFTGKKHDEARGGHIPGAINRPFSEDVVKTDTYNAFKPIDELQKIYGNIIPTKETQVIVHCRTGHQASQTYFILVRLLGYTEIKWYDAGWTEWAAKPELPVE